MKEKARVLLAEDLDAEMANVRDELRIQRCLLEFARSCPALRYTMWDAKGGIMGLERRVHALEDRLAKLYRAKPRRGGDGCLSQ